jgi:hypothetical protein
MVIYRGVDGKPGYQQAEDIHDAVAFVEQMRNEEGVEQARIFRLEEVTFEYRPYYRVELSNGAPVPDTSFIGPGSAPAPTPTPMVGPTQMPTTADLRDDLPVPPSDETFDVVDPTGTIDVDAPETEAMAANGARRGLFGR